MANMQIKGIEEGLYREIKRMAAQERRSVSQQILFLVKEYLTHKHHLERTKAPAQTLLELSASWLDDREAAEIVQEIKDARNNSKKLEEGF